MAVAPMVTMGMPNMMVTMGMGGMAVPVRKKPSGGGGILFIDDKQYCPKPMTKPMVICVEKEGKTVCEEVQIEPVVQIDEVKFELQEDIIKELQAELAEVRRQLEERQMVMPLPPPPREIVYYPRIFTVYKEVAPREAPRYQSDWSGIYLPLLPPPPMLPSVLDLPPMPQMPTLPPLPPPPDLAGLVGAILRTVNAIMLNSKNYIY